MTDLTGPEYHCARSQAKAAVGPNRCRWCVNRVELFGEVICSGHAGRTFRECTRDGLAPTFLIDPKLEG